MSIVSARVFNQSPSKVKAMTADGPVFVTDRGRPAVVLLSIDEYTRLRGGGSIREALRMDADIDFEPVISRDIGRVAAL